MRWFYKAFPLIPLPIKEAVILMELVLSLMGKFPLIPLPIKEAVRLKLMIPDAKGVVSINSTSYKGSGIHLSIVCDCARVRVSINSTSYKGSGKRGTQKGVC